MITKHGIEGHDFPVSYPEILKAGRDFEYGLAMLLREHKNQDDAAPYKIAAKNFLCTVCGFFQGALLEKRMAEQGLQIKNIPASFKSLVTCFLWNRAAG